MVDRVLLALGFVTLVLFLAPIDSMAAETNNSTISSGLVLVDGLNTTVKSENKTSSMNKTSTKSTRFLPILFPFMLFNRTFHKNGTRGNITQTTTTTLPFNGNSSLHKRAINSTISVVDLKNSTQSLKNATISRLNTTQSLKSATIARLINATRLSSGARVPANLNASSNRNVTDSVIGNLNSTVASPFGMLVINGTANVTFSAGHHLNDSAIARHPTLGNKTIVNANSSSKAHTVKRAVDLDNNTKSDNVSAKSFTSVVQSIPSLLLNATSDVTKLVKDLVIGSDEHSVRAERSVNATKSDNSTRRFSKDGNITNASTKVDFKVDKLQLNTTVESTMTESSNNASTNSSHVRRREAFYGTPHQYQQPQPVYVSVYPTTPAPVYPTYPSYPSYQSTEGPYDAMAAYAAPGAPYSVPSYASSASYAAPTYGPAYGQQAPVSESYYTAPVPAYTTTAPYSYVVPQQFAQASYRPSQQPAYVEPARPYVAAPQTYAPSAPYVQPSPNQPGAPPVSPTLSPWF